MIIREYIRATPSPSRPCYEIKCDCCKSVFERQIRVYRKSKYPNHCKNCRPSVVTGKIINGAEKYHCLDCGTEIHRGSIRCRKCYGKSIQTLKPKYCIDCNVLITSYAKKCLKCHNITQNKNLSRERTKFNNSKKWAKIRNFAFKRDDYTCNNCKKRGVYLECHHLHSYKNYPSKRLDINNVVTVCYKCHKEIHFGNNKILKQKYIHDS
jgi:5-methylcytosine-specific restriction endonuclease McrA